MMKKNRNFFFFVVLAAAFFGSLGVATNFGSGEQPGIPKLACGLPDLEPDASSEKIGIFEGRKVLAPTIAPIAREKNALQVLGSSVDSRWIEIDLSEQKLRAWDGSQVFLESLVSTGLPRFPTPTGDFRIGFKNRAQKMEGGEGKDYYYLPNVPYVMFFGNEQIPWSRGFGLHGTYWHSDFGNVRSHGCINLPTSVAEQLYYWVGPALEGGSKSLRSTAENPGARVVIHE